MVAEYERTWREIQKLILDAIELSGRMRDARFGDAEPVIEELCGAYCWLEKMRGLFEDPEWLQNLLEDSAVEWFR